MFFVECGGEAGIVHFVIRRQRQMCIRERVGGGGFRAYDHNERLGNGWYQVSHTSVVRVGAVRSNADSQIRR